MRYKEHGNRHFTVQGRVAKITIDLVLQARAKMPENKVIGPEDSVVSETIEQLPQEKIYEITRCFQGQFMDVDDASSPLPLPSSSRIVKLVFLRKLDAAMKKGIRSYTAVALTSVMSKLYATCVLLRLLKEKELD